MIDGARELSPIARAAVVVPPPRKTAPARTVVPVILRATEAEAIGATMRVGGLRVVDVSGELVGNLAEQRREIAVFKAFDPNGRTANASFAMNAMPWKGHILFTDFNSGLWVAKLEPKQLVP